LIVIHPSHEAVSFRATVLSDAIYFCKLFIVSGLANLLLKIIAIYPKKFIQKKGDRPLTD
jgi:hypothetical protein